MVAVRLGRGGGRGRRGEGGVKSWDTGAAEENIISGTIDLLNTVEVKCSKTPFEKSMIEQYQITVLLSNYAC